MALADAPAAAGAGVGATGWRAGRAADLDDAVEGGEEAAVVGVVVVGGAVVVDVEEVELVVLVDVERTSTEPEHPASARTARPTRRVRMADQRR